MFKRHTYHLILQRVKERRGFIQVLAGPRQVGKTTLARQVMDGAGLPVHFASADEPALKDRMWISQQWEAGRLKCAYTGGKKRALLILDEVQKIPDWPETIKRLWDEDSASGLKLKVLLLGSSPLLFQKGLSESLAGRFEIIPVTHWTYPEMRTAFKWSLERFLIYGGYPGAARLIRDEDRWKRYILDSLVETTLSRDVLLLNRVDKPALLRRLFHLCGDYSGQILSYQKMIGQLTDAGNTTTLAHYLDLLNGAGLAVGISKYSGRKIRRRASSPKLVLLNSALMTALGGLSGLELRQNPELWGRHVEAAVGAHLVNQTREEGGEVFYWREGNNEVDYILHKGSHLAALEVKSGRKKIYAGGMEAFHKAYPSARAFLIGPQGIPLEDFFSAPIDQWLR